MISELVKLNKRFEYVLFEIFQIQKEHKIKSHGFNDYLEIMSYYIREQFAGLSSFSALPNADLLPTIYIDFDSSLIFDANIFIDDDDAVRNFSYGAILAIDDLFFRLGANKGFYSYNVETGKFMWSGCDCFWTRMGGRSQPNIRFYDYRYSENNGLGGEHGTYLSSLFEVVPLDIKRLKLVQLMNHIGFLWILLHEEGHFYHGHLYFFQELFGLNSSGLMAIQETKKQENIIYSEDSCENKNKIRKVMEWQADRFAISGIIDLFFREEIAKLLPNFTKEKPNIWLLRLILSSVCSVILIFQKAISIQGSSPDYPSPLERVITAIHIGVSRALHPKGETMHLSIPDITPTIMGTLEDLGFTSVLLNKEGEVKEWQPGIAPNPEQTHPLGLLDNDIEIHETAEVITYSFLPDEYLKETFGQEKYESLKQKSQRIFGELDDIYQLSELMFSNVFRKYRIKAGNIL